MPIQRAIQSSGDILCGMMGTGGASLATVGRGRGDRLPFDGNGPSLRSNRSLSIPEIGSNPITTVPAPSPNSAIPTRSQGLLALGLTHLLSISHVIRYHKAWCTTQGFITIKYNIVESLIEIRPIVAW
ncbi:Chalcone synthase A [Senna tora]|uniref:Chalcone synthase A n=1 Tax=Senna tora TaxID=362788 RepID=A0A835CGW7_9FABA|nr:Chalcone synthase A [Senna tora]